MIKKILLSPWTALITLVLVLGVRIADPAFVESVRLRYFDTLVASKTPTVNNIYTVNIDESSLDKYGQWPLPRGEYADIIDDLYQRNAGLVVVNVLMADPDRQRQDGQLAQIMKKYPVILNNVPSDRTKNIPRNPGAAIVNSEFSDLIVTYPGVIANVPVLENNAAGVGIVNTMPEIDGVNRRLPLVVAVDGKLYPSLALEVLRVAAGDPNFQIKLNELGVDKLRVPAFGAINTDSLGRVWIDWSQRSQSVSLVDLPTDFNGAVVILAPTAAGIANPVPASIGPVHPHELQASVLATVFNGVSIQRPSWADPAEVVILALTGLLLIFLSRWIYVGIASFVIIIGGGVFASIIAYKEVLWLVDITGFSIGLVLVVLHAYTVKFVSEFLQKQQIKKQFGTYLSPALVEKLQRNPELLQLGGDSRELSIMFTDVRGFTSISEHYGRDVQGLTKIMNRYMTAMTAKILENNGTLDKYIGDAQMAFWNAPLDEPAHAKMAVKTALEMLGSLDAFNEEIASEGVPAFGMGLGINTDTVVVGNMGSSQRFDYTCLGDGVNLASRLEGQSKPYGVRIVLGTKTAELVKDEYFVLELDKIAVKGKKEGVNIYTVLTNPTTDWNSDREVHELMLDYYRQQKWDIARRYVAELQGAFGGQMDTYYEHWLERIDEMSAKSLPGDWDGTYVATSK